MLENMVTVFEIGTKKVSHFLSQVEMRQVDHVG